ncbi:hypothetical protein Taro_051011 [Colocasia esculenta]|uniref:Uncharacterized protein n=1 Tax=Colocasia esculenta TaxID=4460 RepID=A0A843XEV6_COLES|nr:hypothetical protein [Colocasia esculenta]
MWTSSVMNLAAKDVDVWLGRFGLTRALFFPHSLLSTSPTFTLELLHEFRWLAGARGKAVVHVVAADQAGNVKLERGVCGAFLGFRRDSRFFGSSIVFLRVLRPETLEVPGMGLQLCVCSCVSYPMRDFGSFAGGGSGYGALMGLDTPVRHITRPEFLAERVEATELGGDLAS